jgi:hypothetical protein
MAISVRHILDTSEYGPDTIHQLKADAMFSPVVENKADITVELITDVIEMFLKRKKLEPKKI